MHPTSARSGGGVEIHWYVYWHTHTGKLYVLMLPTKYYDPLVKKSQEVCSGKCQQHDTFTLRWHIDGPAFTTLVPY